MNGPVLLNGNGRPVTKGNDYITVDQVKALIATERDEAEKMVKWYMSQFPELVATMLAQAFIAHGLTLQAPPSPEGVQ